MTEMDARDMFMNGESASKRLALFLDSVKAADFEMPETAVLVSRAGDLNDISLSSFDRIYFGAEFCDKKLPAPEEWDAAAGTARKSRLPLTLVTPYFTESGLERVTELLKHVARENAEAEIVVNDWGAFNFIRRELPSLRPVIGRVLVRQKKDPRIAHIRDVSMKEYFIKSLIDNRRFRDFLTREGAVRAELDNPLHGVDVQNKEHCPALSLYFPFVFLTTSRQCAPGSCEKCGNTKYVLRNDLIGCELAYIGRSQFYLNTDLSALRGGGFSRLVYQYTLPV
jgi:hypothetical protein